MEVRLLQSQAQLAHADNIPLFQHFGQLQRPQWNWGNSFSTKDSAHKRHVLCLSKTGVFWIYIFIKYKHIHMHIYFGEVSLSQNLLFIFSISVISQWSDSLFLSCPGKQTYWFESKTTQMPEPDWQKADGVGGWGGWGVVGWRFLYSGTSTK